MALTQTFNEDVNGNVQVNVINTAIPVKVQDGSGTAITSTNDGGKQALDVNIANSSVAVSGTVDSNIHDSSGNAVNATAGSLNVNVTNASVTVAGTVSSKLEDGAGNNITSTAVGGKQALDVNIVTAPEAPSSTATITSVSASASSVSLLASNPSRKGFMVFNDSNSVCYLAFGATSSATAFTVKLQANAYYENNSPLYNGAISGIWTNANGAARITELT